ncbi:DsrE family protein [Candidatus Bipolaricaulota bacterium]|nr:DsrE family protein [Candidatus Bipolaricaulota bacterium]
MSDKLAVILASGDIRVLEMGLMYARNACKHGWMSDVKVFLFGPSETQVATDPGLREAVSILINEGMVPVACKYCSDKYSVSDALRQLGCGIEYVGTPISDAIKAGYVPMVC